MCSKHSLLINNQGRIFDGFGIVHSHSLIAELRDIDEDAMNKYECYPRSRYGSGTIDGWVINQDTICFDPKDDEAAILAYLHRIYPTVECWRDPAVDLDGFVPVWLAKCQKLGWSIDDFDTPEGDDWKANILSHIIQRYGDTLDSSSICSLLWFYLGDSVNTEAHEDLIRTMLKCFKEEVKVLKTMLCEAMEYCNNAAVALLVPYVEITALYVTKEEMLDDPEFQDLSHANQELLTQKWE